MENINTYKVSFSGNLPVRVELTDINEHREMMKITRSGKHMNMEWLVVCAPTDLDVREVAVRLAEIHIRASGHKFTS